MTRPDQLTPGTDHRPDAHAAASQLDQPRPSELSESSDPSVSSSSWQGPLGPVDPHDGWGALVLHRFGSVLAPPGDDRVDAAARGRHEAPAPPEQWSPTRYVGPRRHRPEADPDARSVDAIAAGQVLAAPAGQPDEAPNVLAAAASALGTAPEPAPATGPAADADAASNDVDAASDAAGDETAGAPAASETNRSLMSSSRTMAVASLASRITGFLRSIVLTAALGIGVSKVADSYNLANTLPNMVYELLLGGVLSSVVIPLIVHSQEHDADGGEAYTQRLLSWATMSLAVTTALAVVAAPLLAAAFASEHAQRQLISILASLLLPEIFFYGLGAMFTAVLNTRGVYGPPAWAPVLNNVITIATIAAFTVLPGPAQLTEATITNTQVLVLGVGTTAGIAVQALVLVPYLRRAGFRWRWRFRAAPVETVRMGEVRTLAAWVLGYVAISQVGVYVVNRVANEHTGGPTTFTNGDLLFQMPYGIIGVSLLTALMPRMSRAAARGDRAAVIDDLSLGSRLSGVGLIPITGGLMVLGPALAVVLFAHGRATITNAHTVGVLLSLGAFGLLPFALVMLQLRVFYAMRDARTPTLINVFMVATKVVLVLTLSATLHGSHVVEWLEFATSTSYLVGAVAGYVLLSRRFGRLGFAAVGRTIARMAAVTAVASLAALAVLTVAQHLLGSGRGGALAGLLGGAVGGLAVLVVALRLIRVPEIDQLVATVRRR